MKTSCFFISILLMVSFIGCKEVSSIEKEAEAFAQKLLAEGETPGMAISVSSKNKIIWSEGIGYADLENKTEVFPDKTRFRIGSISKALTSAAVGILISQEKLDMDVPIQEYLPEYPVKRWEITTRQLAGHLAGIRHYKGDEVLSAIYYPSVKEGLMIFQDDTLLFEPGTKYQYSSYGYNLLSAIIEVAANQEYLEFMQEKVFSPLKMDHTVADLKDTLISFRSGFYNMDNGQTINAPYVDNSYKWAGGGYLSTSEDIVKFGNAMLFADLFQEEIINELISTQKLINGEETGYGIGWSVGTNEFGRNYFGHGGGSVGGSCNLIIFPGEQLVIAALTNDSRSKVGNDLHALAELFMQ